MRSDLKLKPDGTVDVNNLTAYSTSLAGNMMVFLQLTLATAPEHLACGDKVEQVLMTPQAALDLAQTLQNAAHTALSDKSGRKGH